ncbi:hypothetical protein Hypma_008331 [Hypsizygus marmoreus]|uniref:Uncharacterized protein n=1 Tax=Hypsizygus marmoreus TaxID=39966 RepID=A0A369JY03_HYPMA|nr:hypothetical protein Hypma_008331 [Hypsizygus marmoreus]
MLKATATKESSKNTRKRTDIALHASEVILSTLQNAARLTPLPFLRDAATLAVGIITAAQGARGNKDALQRLGNDAGALVCAVISKEKDQADGLGTLRTMNANLEELISTLSSIKKFAKKHASRNFLVRMMLHKHDLAQIQEYRESLRHALDLFGLRSTLELQENVSRIVQLVSERSTTNDISSQAIQQPGSRGAQIQRRDESLEGGNHNVGADRVMLQRDSEEGGETTQPLPADDRHPQTVPDASRQSGPQAGPFAAASSSARQSESPSPQPNGLASGTPIPPSPPPSPLPHTNTNPFLDSPQFGFTSVSGNYNVVRGGVRNTNSGNTTTTIVSGSGNDSSVRTRRGRRR